MPFDINSFKTRGVKYGFTRPSLFLVRINPNASNWMNASARHLNQLTYLCAGASLPGVNILTSDEKVLGQGLTTKIPYDVGFSDIGLRFYSDGEGNTLTFFHGWMKNIVAYGSNDIRAVNGAMPGEVHYPQNYKTTIDIFQYNDHNDGEEGAWVLHYQLIDAYPIQVGEVATDWASGDEISSLNVNFTFKSYTLTQHAVTEAGTSRNISFDHPAAESAPYYERINQSAQLGYDNAVLNTSGAIGSTLSSFTGALGAINQALSIRDALNQVRNFNASNILSSVRSTVSSQIPSVPGGFRFP